MRKCAFLLLFGLASLLQGCIPGVGWLPDSSGFVFTTPTGDLIIYDVATKKQRVLLHDRAAATTCWPAVSPSGKRIALASLQDSDDKTQAMLQIEICDLQGKIEFSSDKIKFATFTGTRLQYSTQIVWSPDEKKLLLHCQGTPAGSGSGFDGAALFDFESQKLKLLEDYVPAYFGSSPVRPDGNGFLLASLLTEKSFAWVDWNGNKTNLNVSVFDQEEVRTERMSPWYALVDSRWDGAKAVLTTPKHRYIIDTQKLKITVEKIPEADSRIDNELIHKRVELASGVELFLLVKDDGDESKAAAHVVSRTKGDPTLTEVIAPIRDQMILLNLSPDRKHAIVRVSYGYRGSKGDIIYVIDNSGQLHDTITVKERGGPSARYEEKQGS